MNYSMRVALESTVVGSVAITYRVRYSLNSVRTARVEVYRTNGVWINRNAYAHTFFSYFSFS